MEVRAGSLALLLVLLQLLLTPISAAQQGTTRDSGQSLLTVGQPADVEVNAERLQAAALMVQHAPTTVTLINTRSGRICYHEVSASRPEYSSTSQGFFLSFDKSMLVHSKKHQDWSK